jgi:hypothetical protein
MRACSTGIRRTFSLTVHVKDPALVCRSDVADVGSHEFVRAQSGEHRRQDDGPVALGPVRPDFRSWWARESGNAWFDLRKRGMSGFGSCYYTAGCSSAGLSVGGSVVAGCEVEVLGGFRQVEGGEDGLVPAGEGGALRDAAVGGGEGDQVHAVEFVA